jgi:AmmeMemoRadiSam system protein B
MPRREANAIDARQCPRLRPFLAAVQDELDSRFVLIVDRIGLAPEPQRLTVAEFMWAQLFDGERTLHDIQAEASREAGDETIPLERFIHLAERLESSLFLDGPRFRERVAQPIREPACIGCYEEDPVALRRQIQHLFSGPGGPGMPRERRPDGRLRAALVPHIDYARGGTTFAWGFKEVFEKTDASLFVIIGTSHYSAQRFTLTRKNFKTPLGVVPTDQLYIDRLVEQYGPGLFDDEIAHLPEHSIELELVFLQYWYNERRPIRIVPLVVGTFQDWIDAREPPTPRSDVARMVEALRAVEAQTREPICYLISGDLAHIGPKFGDTLSVGQRALEQSERQDRALLRHTEAIDMPAYFELLAGEKDARRICGFPPTYTLLEAVRPSRGSLLHYDQYVHPRGNESVSFASMAFYR